MNIKKKVLYVKSVLHLEISAKCDKIMIWAIVQKKLGQNILLSKIVWAGML